MRDSVKLAVISLALIGATGCSNDPLPYYEGEGASATDLGSNAAMDSGIRGDQSGSAPSPDCPPSSSGGAWPMHGFCAAHTKRSPYVGPAIARERWRTSNKTLSTEPVMDATGNIYVGTGFEQRPVYGVAALDAVTGEQKWFAATPIRWFLWK